MNIAGQRLHNQHISGQEFQKPADVVRWLGAVQAQDYEAALWAVGLRLVNATKADVEQAIADRSIIRTWPMRGTLHFVAPEDVRWMLQLLTPRIIAGSAGRYRQLELDERVFAQSTRLLVKALQGGHLLTRPAVYQVLERANISTAHSRGLHILGHLAQKGIICFGPRQGKQPSFTLLEEWVPPSKTLARDEALAELARRYFTSHGPATVHDFAWWSGLKIADARLGIAMAALEREDEEINDQTYWFARSTPVAYREPGEAYLLPSFDEFIVAYKDRSLILAPNFKKQVNAGGGILNPTVVTDSQITGTWKRKLKPKSVTIEFYPFGELNQKQVKALSAATNRYGTFLNLPVELL